MTKDEIIKESMTVDGTCDAEKLYGLVVGKAIEQYEQELREMKTLLNIVADGAGKLISVGGSLSKFKKALEN